MSIRSVRCSASLLSAAILVGSAVPAFGWGNDGHVIVATIAEAHLKQPAKKGIRDLLESQRLSDPRTATWADRIKPVAAMKKQFPNNSLWHFIDTPLEEKLVDIDRDGKNGDNVVTKMIEFQKTLADTTKDKDLRRDALLFIVHFHGDVHQPLHCIDHGDRGGNDIKIKISGEHLRDANLHSFWDTIAVEMLMNQVDVPDFSGRLDASITGALITKWEKGGPVDWAQDTHSIAMEKGYKLGGMQIEKGKVVELDELYIKTAKETIQEQLQKAGIRLAKTLNDTFPE